jgi:putative ABC transport system permease protein
MAWFRRLGNTLRGGRVRNEIERELAFHLAEREDDLRAQGLTAAEARRQARRRLGNPAVQADRTRDVDVSLGADALLRNLRHAFRSFARTPGFTAAVVLTLALGIGANTAVFSALDAVLLRPLPFPEGDRLMQLRQMPERWSTTPIAPSRLEDWNHLNATFQAITGYYTEDVAETSGDVPEQIRRAWVAPRFFDVLGVRPALGRTFIDAEYVPGGPRAVVISDRYWRRRFGASPDAVGRSVQIGRASVPVVGVMAESFRFADREVDLWSPVAIDGELARLRHPTWYTGIGRLRPGVTIDAARADLALVQAQLAQQFPETDSRLGVEILPLKETAIGGIRSSLWLLFGAVTALLLITCTNVAALLLSRAVHRRQEMAVRVSLGATRRALAAQMLAETGAFAVAGTALGLAAAAAVLAAFRSAGSDLPRMDEIALDGRVLVYTLSSALAVTLLCGVVPAIAGARSGMARMTPDASRTQVSGRSTLQWLLVGAQVALSVALLTGAALFLRSAHALSQVDPGFDPARVLTFRVSANWAETTEYKRLMQRIDSTLEALRALPGIDGAATALFPPGVPAQYDSTFQLTETALREARHPAASRVVSPDYFATVGIPLLAGEICRQGPLDGEPQLMVNQLFAAQYLADRASPLGLHLFEGGRPRPPGRIVGVVGNARERGLDRDAGPVVYTCFNAPTPMPYFLIRTRVEPERMAETVRVTLKEIEPLRAVFDIAPLASRIDDAFSQERLRMLLLAAFAVTALALASVGLSGTLSYLVSRRRREIGLRLALGSQRHALVWQFLGQALRVLALACVCGLALALALGRTVAGLLFGVSPADPAALTGVVTVVLAVGTLAALVPAIRAARVEPMQVLRDE